MQCAECGSALDRPGDYCLVCRSANADTVVLELGRERSTVTAIADESVVSQRTVTTTPEDDGELAASELRAFAGQIADDARRKRPETVYAAGDRAVIRAVRAQLRYPFYRLNADDPVEQVLADGERSELEVIEGSLGEKLGGSHSTIIGDRDGREVLGIVADHPHVKKVIPGPIDAGGSGSRTGLRAKVTRADGKGNLRLLVRDGSSVQENRVITTADGLDRGEVVREDLNAALAETGFRDEG